MKHLLAALLLFASIGNLHATNPVVEIRTNQGVITIELFEKDAPKSVANFLEYVRTGYYDGTVFHRVIDGFMIQGGGFDTQMRQKPTLTPIENEARNGLRNEQGTIAMARTRDPHSASSQFFINLVNNRPLDYPSNDGWGYAVFGKVSGGFDVVQKIGRVPTGTVGPFQNTPTSTVVIESVRLVEAQATDPSTR
jgi:peptidyl-prolyl cis-trans isomerase A (cyclophilin A)